jgi:hypothetical protein
MSTATEQLRRQYEKVVCGNMGVPVNNRRQLGAEQVWSTREAELLALPQDLTEYRMLQDPLTGEWPFMLGFSILGGPDEIA